MSCCGGGNVSFLRIPSNIKQIFAPFQAVPGGGQQVFSFKPARLQGAASAGLLNIVPSSISQNSTRHFAYDLGYWYQKEPINFNKILDMLPSVQIREYLPDTKLDQSLNFFQDMFTNIFKGHEEKEKETSGNNVDDTTAKSEKLTNKLKNVVNEVMKKIDSTGFLEAIAGKNGEIDSCIAGGGQQVASVLKFPYFMYYKIQSCRTTNLYELPCVPSNGNMYSSDGHPGWEGASASGFRLLPQWAKSVPIVGKILDTVFGNMGINFTPWWDAENGSTTRSNELELKFSLFNDNINGAIANFIFVSTLIAHCRWVQYGIMQHSSSLYDISIAGIGKEYACMGSFDVQYKGTLRKPSQGVLDQLSMHKGSKYTGSIVDESTIKIPDVYDVTMKFQSLLPANFNTYIFNFMKNDMMNFYQKNPVQDSAFKRLTDQIKNVKAIAAGKW